MKQKEDKRRHKLIMMLASHVGNFPDDEALNRAADATERFYGRNPPDAQRK